MSLALTDHRSSVVPLAAAVAATLLALTATGDTVLLSVLLGLSSMSPLAGGVAAGAAAAVLLRWGTTSLGAVAGAQAVLGPAAVVGSTTEAASALLAAAALVLVSPRGWAAVPFGASAALIAAGPMATGLEEAILRLVTTVIGAVVAMAAGRWLPARVASKVAVAVVVVAVALAGVG